MDLRDLVGAVQRWLPWGVFLFEGGPLDGQRRKVDLIETDYGLIAPKIWAYDEWPDEPISCETIQSPVAEVTIRRHFYRFEPTRSANQGRYVLIAEARR